MGDSNLPPGGDQVGNALEFTAGQFNTGEVTVHQQGRERLNFTRSVCYAFGFSEV